MFENCTGLTSAPNLPAEIIKYASYQQMFKGCTGLLEAPELLTNTVETNGCYQMFYRLY
jgi:hypothetical protein